VNDRFGQPLRTGVTAGRSYLAVRTPLDAVRGDAGHICTCTVARKCGHSIPGTCRFAVRPGRTLHHIVTASGHIPSFRTATLALQPGAALAAGGPTRSRFIGNLGVQPTLGQQVLASMDQRIVVRYGLTGRARRTRRTTFAQSLGSKLAGRMICCSPATPSPSIRMRHRGYSRAVNNVAVKAFMATFGNDYGGVRR